MEHPKLNKKVAFHTLGCKLNFSESSTIARDFTERGYQRVKHTDIADVYIINTCTVTEMADRKCRQAVRKVIKQNPDAIVAVIGCFAQLKPDEITTIPGVDIVLGSNEKFRLFQYIDNLKHKEEPIIHGCGSDDLSAFNSAYSSGDRTRSFLKVQDGCNYRCSYCTVPNARGNSRNDSIENTIKRAREIVSLGYKEIILTGVNIGDFGQSTNEQFIDLIKELDKVEGIERYRISSIEPNLLTDEIIEFVAKSGKFLPHFHIPLQSGSDDILALMKRRYKTALFADLIEKIKAVMPRTFIGVDVIVGFPGETDEKFMETYRILEKMDISFLHVFSYSVRQGTLAAGMDGKISQDSINKRSKQLHQLSELKHRAFYEKNLNTEAPVLFESKNENGKMHGFTDNYLKVVVPYSKKLINQIVPVKLQNLTKSNAYEIKTMIEQE